MFKWSRYASLFIVLKNEEIFFFQNESTLYVYFKCKIEFNNVYTNYFNANN